MWAGIFLLAATSLANAATFLVSTNADAGPGSLRQAIRDANVSPGADTVSFNLPPTRRTIIVKSPLPRISDSLVIDAAAQPGVRVVGPGNYIGFEINATAVKIRDIAIEDFTEGVRITGGNSNRIVRCSIIGHSLWGIALEGGTYHEIFNNVISGNRFGISDGFGSRGTNFIRGNLIGTDATGTNAMGNLEYGIWGAGYSHLVIGGVQPGQSNVISGNGSGIHLTLFGGIPSLIQGNFIGTDRSGTLDLGNTWAGVSLVLGSNHVGGVEAGAGNVIAFNGGNGVIADAPTWIQGNRIFANGLLGIEEANTHYPFLSHAAASTNSTLIGGTLAGAPLTTYRIEFFGNDTCDPSGFGEGQRFLGFTTATTDSDGRGQFAFTFSEALPIASVVTATATSPQGGTSRFSPCRSVGRLGTTDLSVRQTDYPDPADLATHITYNIAVSNAGPSIATNVLLENVFPPNMMVASVQTSQGACSNAFDRTVCSLGNMNPGASASATISVQPYFFLRVGGGYYTNRATVSSLTPDPTPENNVSEEVTTVGLSDLGVSLSVGPPPFRAGEPFVLTVHLTNAGPSRVHSFNVSLWSWSQNVSIAPSDFYVTNLEAGASQDIPVSAAALTDGSFYISARIYAFNLADPVSTNDSAFLQLYAEPGPGVLILEREAYAIQENGQAVLRVLRVGGSQGVLSAFYTTSDGTAVANSDYVPAVGELTFAPGQTEARIAVPAVPDQTAECNEFFSVQLRSGAGTILGRQTNALVSIAERPPSLAGYVRPLTVSAADPLWLLGNSGGPVEVSADGTKILFASSAAGLVEPPLTTVSSRIFMRDLETGATVQLTPNPTNLFGSESYYWPSLSGNARVAAFVHTVWSDESPTEVIVRNLDSGSNTVASLGIEAQWLGSLILSSNGAIVVFRDSSNRLHAFDVLTRSNYLVIGAHDASNSYSSLHGLSADGRFVLFSSSAPLVTNDLNGSLDLFVRDLMTHTTHLVSVDTNGLAAGSGSGAVISGDGRRVAFSAYGFGLSPEVSDWGAHTYVRDITAGTTRLVSTNTGYNPSISADGRFIAFESQPTTGQGMNVLSRDMQTGTTTLASESCSGTTFAHTPRVSGDGRFVFFESSDITFTDGEFLPNDKNIFRWDRLTGETTLVSVNKHRTGGALGWENVYGMSHDGNALAFTSDGPDLAFGDYNLSTDVFVWQAGTLPRLTISLSEGVVTITWPSDSPAAVLETKTPQSSWAPVGGSIRQENGWHIYQTTPQGSAPRFFQLRVL